MKKSYHKQENERVLNSLLLIHWWNFRSKTLHFKGTAKEYLERENIKIKIIYYKDKDLNIEQSNINISFNCGSMNKIKFSCKSMEDAIRMVINIRLSYLGDKSQFNFLGRTRTINF